MQDTQLSGPEFIVLELIHGLGREVHCAHLEQIIRKSLRPRCHEILRDLFEMGLVFRYAPGQYAITKEGRQALVRQRGSADDSWLS